jgi:hypothetical protein
MAKKNTQHVKPVKADKIDAELKHIDRLVRENFTVVERVAVAREIGLVKLEIIVGGYYGP